MAPRSWYCRSLPHQKNPPWRFVFIVPPNMASAFKLQGLKGDTKKGAWAGKVNKYVLGLDVGGAAVVLDLADLS